LRRVPLDCGVRWLLQKANELLELSVQGLHTWFGFLSYRFEPQALILKILNILLLFKVQHQGLMRTKVAVLNNSTQLLYQSLIA